MSGTGKSSLLAELARRGHDVVDTDDPGWIVEVDGERLWDETRLAALLARDPLVVQGTVANQGRFYDRFDAVVLLSAPAGVLLERLATRTTNDFGKSEEERTRILDDLEHVEPLLRRGCTHELDATRPLPDLADEVERLVKA
jgi:dephospho-CoA kinase